MKRVLIISPYFSPANTADMQRIRMSLPYFENFGWDAEVVTVEDEYIDTVKDPLLLQSIPNKVKIHRVKALSKKWTSKLGLGNLALRSLWFYRNKVNELLKKETFDLIYFSTTAFPICILGAYWKKKHGIPYVIDMQDPWHTDYYQSKTKKERPKKYWFSYRLNKYLEPIAMKSVDGLISVSANYIDTLKVRYPYLKDKPSAVITFGAFDLDFKIATINGSNLKIRFDSSHINLVYVGRGGYDLHPALNTLFTFFKKGLELNPIVFKKIRMHFIGTSYAPRGKGEHTILPMAQRFNILPFVHEQTDRIGFYDSINCLQQADGLLIIGSNQAAYTASKLYPYILAKKPLLAVLHQASSATQIIKDCNAGYHLDIDANENSAFDQLNEYLQNVVQKLIPQTNWKAFQPYTASAMTKEQVNLFNKVI
ncbi:MULTISPECIES: glycosyltransferase [unclassified Pedobacter]|uniref:glycosyltransferase n=1 Tax=unclassified Pedobacter TaxID=2628915 RepID=UPI002035471B|nr:MULTISPECIES: glycosyltransferase [unclassified Pedobacter]